MDFVTWKRDGCFNDTSELKRPAFVRFISTVYPQIHTINKIKIYRNFEVLEMDKNEFQGTRWT